MYKRKKKQLKMMLINHNKKFVKNIIERYAFFSTVNIQTKLAQAGCKKTDDNNNNNNTDLTPPIHFSTTFEREKDLSYLSHIYSRTSNPTRDLLEETIADLENGTDCCSFASGSAATSSLLTAVGNNSHVIIGNDVYHGTRSLLENVFNNWGLFHTEIDLTNIDIIKNEVETIKTQGKNVILISEIPTNPSLNVPDLIEISNLLRNYENCIHICDSTWMSPAICNPLNLGVDMVLHSTTKYMGGHSDLLGGCIAYNKQGNDTNKYSQQVFDQIRIVQQQSGNVPSPFDSWLLLRGLRSLDARIARHCENAFKIAEYLENHNAIYKINYPGLVSHPQHDIMSKMISNNNRYGGMLSIELKGGMEKAIDVSSKVQIFKRATSLGGTESLIEHRKSIEPENSPTPDSLLRLSIGLENVDDLIKDLDHALRS